MSANVVKPSGSDMAIHEELLHSKIKHLAEIMNANQNIKSIGPTAPSLVEIGQAVIYTRIASADKGFHLPSGSYASFEGTAWGAAVGFGAIWMTAMFGVPESSIFGEVSFKLQTLGGVTNLEFWRGSILIGSAVGAGLAAGVGLAGGGGKFTKRD